MCAASKANNFIRSSAHVSNSLIPCQSLCCSPLQPTPLQLTQCHLRWRAPLAPVEQQQRAPSSVLAADIRPPQPKPNAAGHLIIPSFPLYCDSRHILRTARVHLSPASASLLHDAAPTASALYKAALRADTRREAAASCTASRCCS